MLKLLNKKHRFGYAGEILKIDLLSHSFTKLTSAEYTDRFLGGRGLAARLYWEMVPLSTKALDPENCLICANGPVAGFTGFAGNRWQVCAKSQVGELESFSYANFGGRWGIMLKYAGYDGLVVQGKADRPVYILIGDEELEIKDASQLWGKSTIETCELLQAELGKEVSVLTIGPAAENCVTFSTLFTDDSASGSGGLGSVMGSKLLKAIVVAGSKRPKAANPQELRNIGLRVKQMRERSFYAATPPWAIDGLTKMHICYGCGLGCSRHMYTVGGQSYKSFCQAASVYLQAGRFPDQTQRLANRLCDQYGLDTSVMRGLINWLAACYKEGLLDEKEAGLPLSKTGSAEFIETLIRKISFREGFGDILARGTIEAAAFVGEKSKELLSDFVSTRRSENKDYDPRIIPTTVILYATEPRRPIQQLHEPSILWKTWLKWVRGEQDGFFTSDDFRQAAEIFWGSAKAADFTTYEGKALAAKKIQDRTYAKESMVFCDFRWPMTWAFYPGAHVGDPTLESRIFSAISGQEVDEDGLNQIGERIFNLQRAVLLREGWQGRRDDRLLDYYYQKPLYEGENQFGSKCEVLGPGNEVVPQVGKALDREMVEKLKSEYYGLRGWDVDSGMPTRTKLEALELDDVASDLADCGLLK